MADSFIFVTPSSWISLSMLLLRSSKSLKLITVMLTIRQNPMIQENYTGTAPQIISFQNRLVQRRGAFGTVPLIVVIKFLLLVIRIIIWETITTGRQPLLRIIVVLILRSINPLINQSVQQGGHYQIILIHSSTCLNNMNMSDLISIARLSQ